MAFIVAQMGDGRTIAINIDHIVAVWPATKTGTIIYFDTNKPETLMNDCDDVINLIRESE